MSRFDNLNSFDEILDKKYGKEGSPERRAFDDECLSFYSGEILKNARKKARITQKELGDKIGKDAAYVSRVERNEIIPTIATFMKIISSLGYSMELKPIL